MCGIIGVASNRPVVDKLLVGLSRQEYRGYDSAGLAVFDEGSEDFRVYKRLGKVLELQSALLDNPINGTTGIAHTRWATHGVPAEKNAHPHHSNHEVYVVHNGIIENHQEIKTTLKGIC